MAPINNGAEILIETPAPIEALPKPAEIAPGQAEINISVESTPEPIKSSVESSTVDNKQAPLEVTVKHAPVPVPIDNSAGKLKSKVNKNLYLDMKGERTFCNVNYLLPFKFKSPKQ